MAVSMVDRDALAKRMIGLIDLTDLADDRAPDGIDELCARAALHGTAAVCVWPEHVARCSRELAGTRIQIATVVNFPTGDEPIGAIATQTSKALDDGAHEIDVVMPYRALLAGDVERVVAVLDSTRDATGDALLKVILETGELVDLETVRDAARLAIEHGADFVKTSTGKTPVSATPDAVRVMLGVVAALRVAHPNVGIKPSGGIRTFDDAFGYLEIADEAMGSGWATPSTFRFGASGLLDALVREIDTA
jgi:deoxyribose-phosphate aldolase